MKLERRAVLKGMALGGLAGVGMAASGLSLAEVVGAGQPQALQPTLVLVSDPVADSAFIHGVNASTRGKGTTVQRTGLGLAFIQGLEQRLNSGGRQRIIGLVDDASAALILDLARSAGARVQWVGQHSASARESHHRLLGTAAAHGCSAQLGQQLGACGTGFSLDEQRPHSGQAPLKLAAAGRGARSEQWAASLGYALASLGTHAAASAPLIAAGAAPLNGHFVSFSIET